MVTFELGQGHRLRAPDHHLVKVLSQSEDKELLPLLILCPPLFRCFLQLFLCLGFLGLLLDLMAFLESSELLKLELELERGGGVEP